MDMIQKSVFLWMILMRYLDFDGIHIGVEILCYIMIR